MSGVAIEDLLELWSAELRKAKAKLGWLIDHPSVVASAAAFLDTLLGPERRKTGWMRAEAVGDRGPWRQQAVLGRSHWDAEALRDVVRDYALETLAEGDAVLVIDETGFLKQGNAASAGSIPARRARSPTARSVSSPPMSRPGATP
jgi:SRSO17 transposase